MPRGPRLDAPGALHHVMVRGIDRGVIFHDDDDRRRCLDRLGAVITAGAGALYAWCFMPNHVHALIRTGAMPLSRLMRRWIGPYASAFNQKHQRCGYLFQGRFKSILIDEDRYFGELVRYIHLNPVRAQRGISLEDLDTYAWSGHAVLLGQRPFAAQDTDFVLAHFGATVGIARAAYREFLEAGSAADLDLDGGGVRYRAVTWHYRATTPRGRERWADDERILGPPAFIHRVLERAPMPAPTVGDAAAEVTRLCARVAEHFGVLPAEIASRSVRRRVLAARAVLCHLAVRRHALSLRFVGRCLGLSKQSVARALDRAGPLIASGEMDHLLR